jgi:RNA polymerase sigma-70 factor (ECF subfamily)
MDPGQTSANFQPTRWTLIDRARTGSGDLNTLLAEYWSPVYAYLRRKGHQSHDAADLTQSFLAKAVLDRNLLEHADPARGRFRSYLLRALNNFVIDEWRKGKVESAMTYVPDDAAALDRAEPSDADDPASAFERQWLVATLERALRAVERECCEDGMGKQWLVFDARIVRPALYGAERIAFRELKDQIGTSDTQEIYSMILTVKRKVERALRQAIAETVHEREEVDRDVAEMRKLIGL